MNRTRKEGQSGSFKLVEVGVDDDVDGKEVEWDKAEDEVEEAEDSAEVGANDDVCDPTLEPKADD